MRKVYNLLTLAVLFIASSFAVQAQIVQRYAVGDFQNGLTTDGLTDGVKFAMIGSAAASGGTYDVIQGLEKASAITAESFYEVETAGENDEGNPIFVLKRTSTGEYVENQNSSMSYTSSKTRAWKFVVYDATTVTEAELNDSVTLLDNYASVTLDNSGVNKVIFADANGDISKKGGTTFFLSGEKGKAPSFGTNYNLNVISVYPYTEDDDTNIAPMAAYECLRAELNDLGLQNGIENKYIVGEQPGQTPQQYYDVAVAAYEACTNLEAAMSEDMDACNAALEALKKAMKDCDENYIKVEEGFYFFSSGRSETNGVYDKNNLMSWTYQWEPAWTVPTAPGAEREMTMDDVKFVWQIIEDKANPGAYFLQNYYTKRYIGLADNGTGAKVKTIETPTESFLIYAVGKRGDETTWSIESTTLIKKPLKGWGGSLDVTALHCAGDHDAVCIWEPGNSDGSGWRFYKVNMDELNKFDAQIEQSKRNDQLNDIYNEANAAYEAGAYCLDFNGNKNGELDTNEDGTPMGLVTSVDQLSSNCIETAEGKQLAGLLDNDISDGNFYHSIWKDATATDQGFDVTTTYPNITMDLRKAVKDVMIKMWPRRNGGSLKTDNLPGKVSIQASNDGQNWTQIDTLNTALTYKYVSTEGNVSKNNAVATLRITLPEQYQWIRMEVCTRYGSDQDFVKDIHNLNNACWNAAEMRVFECWDNPEIALNTAVDATVLKTFEDALATAKAEKEAESATQATIDALTAAYEAYQNEIPDPSQVTSALNEAKKQLEAAEEGSDYGYFEEGAKAELQGKLDAVQNKVTTVMTKAVITSLKEEIATALAAFNAKIVLPANGALVYVVSGSSEKPNGGRLRTAGNNAKRNQWANADADENIDNRLDYVWKVVRNDDNTFQLQNLLNGQYLNVPKANNAAVGMSAEGDTCKFTIRTAKVAGYVNLVFNDNVFLNAQPNGQSNTGAAVTWNSASGNDNSAWTFVDVDVASNWDGAVVKEVAAQSTYIFTLPISVKADDNCYEVLGRNGSNIELKKIEGNIEGGTPFVYINESDDEAIFLNAVEADYAALTYATEAKTVNGLCGTLAPVDQVPVGYGVLYQNGKTVVDAAKGDGVATNSGYFTSALPETTETGDAQLVIDGQIDAINNATVNTNAAIVNVYSISGVKVRSNVKAENATKSLPAGLYIVGGKKVLVK